MFKFDCRQVTGVIETLHVSSTEQGTVTAYMVIDGQVLPKVLLPGKIYEELDKGQRVTLYGIFTKKKDKMENQAVIYAMKTPAGRLVAARQYQVKVPIMIILAAFPLMLVAFIAGCVIFPYPIVWLTGHETAAYVMPATIKSAVVLSVLSGLFMIGCAINFIRKSNDPEGWAPIGIAELSQRFSKAFK
ncbi:hypothetical protein F3J44_23585 [Pantoea sp. Tr-811]|uniref:hypothetical protein n=1 Tax=Pantoea sp. Tr-811 TaxID=2608361 RepID=UPI001421EF48|nr:hypothetical protein [Pantoea sp. Tr-811]NIF29335.1 hypothetical protein [Pantoea sp. Tr-811]